MEEMAEILRPANLEASRSKPRKSDEDLLRMHLDNRLYYYDQASKDAGRKAAKEYFDTHLYLRNVVDMAIKVGARAAMDFQP